MSLSPISRLAPGAARLGGAPHNEIIFPSYHKQLLQQHKSRSVSRSSPTPEEHLSSSIHKGFGSGAAQMLVCCGCGTTSQRDAVKVGLFSWEEQGDSSRRPVYDRRFQEEEIDFDFFFSFL